MFSWTIWIPLRITPCENIVIQNFLMDINFQIVGILFWPNRNFKAWSCNKFSGSSKICPQMAHILGNFQIVPFSIKKTRCEEVYQIISMSTSMRYGRCVTSSKQKVKNRIFTLVFQRTEMRFSSSHTVVPHKFVSGSLDEKCSNQLKINTIFGVGEIANNQKPKNSLRVLTREIRWLWKCFTDSSRI